MYPLSVSGMPKGKTINVPTNVSVIGLYREWNRRVNGVR